MIMNKPFTEQILLVEVRAEAVAVQVVQAVQVVRVVVMGAAVAAAAVAAVVRDKINPQWKKQK